MLNTHAQRNDAPPQASPSPCSEPEMAERDPSHVPSDGSFAAALLAASPLRCPSYNRCRRCRILAKPFSLSVYSPFCFSSISVVPPIQAISRFDLSNRSR